MNGFMHRKQLPEILAPIEALLKDVDNAIREYLSTGIPLVDDGAGHLFLRGGKKIRASLVILSSGIRGNRPVDVIKLGASVEIIHAATLVHDDIIDKAFLRRGDITVSEKWGNKIAVLLGDYMYTAALEIAVRDENSRLFPTMVAGTRDMVKGELYQLQYSNIDSITENHYFRIIELKTAQFMATCATIGAMKAGLPDDDCRKMGLFALNLGYAFQIVDDTLDMVDDSSATGKDVGNDFEDGKITLPFLYYIQKGGKDALDLLKGYAAKPDDESFCDIKRRLKESGAIEYSMNRARKFIDTALDILKEFPDTMEKSILTELADFIINREY